MKRFAYSVFLLVALSLIAGVSQAAKKPAHRSSSATITVSPSTYTSGAPISFVGSGFAAYQPVSIELQGPTLLWISVESTGKGNISVDYPSGLNLPSGSYAVLAYEPNGINATTAFQVQ